jgi:hypothetical protein
MRFPGCDREYYLLEERSIEETDWHKMLHDHPDVLMYYLSHAIDNENFYKFIEKRNIVEVINVFKKGNILIKDASNWGRYFKSGRMLAETLRAAALEEAFKPVYRSQYSISISPFRLNLPAEADLLPHILGVLLDAHQDGGSAIRPRRREPPRFQLAEALVNYVPDSKSLRPIWSAPSFPRRTRAAALVLHLMHPKGASNNNLKLLAELYDDEDAHWLLPGIGYALFDRIGNGDDHAIECLGNLLERSATNYFARATLDPVLQALSEVPGSPVTKLGRRSLWDQ